MRADDALKYAAAKLASCTDWATDSIAGSMCASGGHEDETDAISEMTTEVVRLAALFGNPLRYSDGRMVKSGAWIDNGMRTEHVWHPDPVQEEPQSWRGHLHSGHPDVPSPGIYEVSTEPSTQDLHVRVVRTV